LDLDAGADRPLFPGPDALERDLEEVVDLSPPLYFDDDICMVCLEIR
jgi:hypothetical protein